MTLLELLIYADNTYLFITVDDPTWTANVLISDLNTMGQWADKWLVTCSAHKAATMLITLQHDHKIIHH